LGTPGATGALIFAPSRGHSDAVTFGGVLAQMPLRLLSGSEDNTIKLWDADDGPTDTPRLEGAFRSGQFRWRFSPDGRPACCREAGYDLSKDNTIKLWDLATGALISNLLWGIPIRSLPVGVLARRRPRAVGQLG